MNDAMESRGEEPTVEELRGEEPTSSSSSRLRFNASYDVHNNKCRENVIKKNVRCNKIYHNLLTIVNEAWGALTGEVFAILRGEDMKGLDNDNPTVLAPDIFWSWTNDDTIMQNRHIK